MTSSIPDGYVAESTLPTESGELRPPILLARHLESGVRVFLLPLEEPLDGDAERRRAFDRVQQMAQLSHPALVVPFDRDETADPPYLAWRWEEGETLRARLKRGPLEAHPAVRIARQIAQALVPVHRAGLAHGALRPANVFVLRGGAVRLLAAGVPQKKPDLPSAGPHDGAAGCAYLAPEQLRDDDAPATTTSDVWTIGVLLYEMLGGELPFVGPNAPTMARAILNGEPEPLGAAPSLLPYDLERTLDWCLAKEPEDRLPHAEALLGELEKVEGLLEPPRPTKPAATAPASRPPRPVSSPTIDRASGWVRERRERLDQDPAPPFWRLFLLPGLSLLLLLVLFLWCQLPR